MSEAIAVMMNNYLHDLAVAFLFASTLMARVTLSNWPERPPRRLATMLRRVAWWSLAWVIAGGAVRAWFYAEYEWLPKAGTAQVPALVVKHALLVGVTVWGLVGMLRLDRMVREGDSE